MPNGNAFDNMTEGRTLIIVSQLLAATLDDEWTEKENAFSLEDAESAYSRRPVVGFDNKLGLKVVRRVLPMLMQHAECRSVTSGRSLRFHKKSFVRGMGFLHLPCFVSTSATQRIWSS